MPGIPIQLGPFVGGLNTESDPSSIADNELVECVNMELDLDGSLISRPPITTTTNDDGWTDRIYLAGTVRIGSDTYIIGSNADGTWQFTGGTWTLITDTMSTATVLQYNDVAYLIPFPGHSSIALAKWTPTGGFSDVSPSNLKTMMSSNSDYGGCSLAIYKGRMFITPGPGKDDNTSRLIFSDPGDPETFSATTQFIDVNPGDGQRLMDMAVFEDNLILFKEDSTYVLSFTSTPSDAELLLLNQDIGVSWNRCVVPYENSLFIYHRQKVYEIRNYNFQCVNIRVPHELDTTAPSTRTDIIVFNRFGERLIIRLGNNIYVYGLRTKTWSTWESADDSLHNFGNLVHYLTSSEDSYYAGSSLDADTNVFLLKDEYSSTTEKNGTTAVDISCSVKTKDYDFGTPYKHKRLMWWGADIVSPMPITGTLEPVTSIFQPTWGMLKNQSMTWDDLLTWGATNTTPTVITTVANSGRRTDRLYIRFPKGCRFRKVNFTIDIDTDGSTLEGPIKLYTLTFIGNEKSFVVQDVN